MNQTRAEVPAGASIVESGDARFTYREAGAGTPLVLLHGIGGAASSWQRQLASLSADYRVIAWDAPGYGGSSCLTQEQPNPADYAAALEQFLHAVGVGACHLLGQSFGCIIAARFARLHPERVLSLTLAGVANGQARLSEEERAKRRAARLDDLAALGPRAMADKRGPRLLGSSASPEVRQVVIETMAKIRPEGYAQAVHMLSAGNTRADILQLPVSLRVQVVYGTHDAVTTPEENIKTAQVRTGIEVTVIPDGGHAVYLECPDIFNSCIRKFAK